VSELRGAVHRGWVNRVAAAVIFDGSGGALATAVDRR
jgi:hypothetical protein